jgi:hypothetical protein
MARLFARLAADPTFTGLRPDADARWQIQLLLTDIFGGPMAYSGPELKPVAARLGLDGGKCALLITHVVAACTEAGMEGGLTARVERCLVEFASAQGFEVVAQASSLPPSSVVDGQVADLIAAGLREAAQVCGPDGSVFVLDRSLTVVHLSAGATRATEAADADLRRAFDLRAADVPGTSILRFHSAPTTLQAVLADAARLPHETTWSFGQVVWRAQFRAVTAPDGSALGYAVILRDESDTHRAQAVFQRLRNQAEDLPVPVMFPDPTFENWFGNAACEHALQRLAPHLPVVVNPLLGVPIRLFFPDADRRRALFQDPERLPYKERVRFGPETVALLVTPVRDQEQRYLGPQITWEIVHFTPEAGSAEPAERPEVANGPEAPVERASSPSAPAAARALRAEARAMARVSEELQTLARLLEGTADHAEGHPHLVVGGPMEPVPEAVRLVEAAAAALVAMRELPPSSTRGGAMYRTLDTLTGIARRTNQLAMDAALLAVENDAVETTEALREEAQALSQGLGERVRALNTRAQGSFEALRLAMATAARVEQWRAQFGEGESSE